MAKASDRLSREISGEDQDSNSNEDSDADSDVDSDFSKDREHAGKFLLIVLIHQQDRAATHNWEFATDECVPKSFTTEPLERPPA